MDFEDDIDGLLDMEADLQEGGAFTKPSIADKRSQEDVATVFGSASKRIRKSSTDNDQELLELAAREPLSPSQHINNNNASDRITTAPTNNDVSAVNQSSSILQAKRPAASSASRQQQPQAQDAELDQILDMEEQPMPATATDAATTDADATTAHSDHDQQQTSSYIFPLQEYKPPQKDAINVHGKYLTITSENGARVYSQLTDDTMNNNNHTTTTTTTTTAGEQQESTVLSRFDIASALRRSRGGLLSTKIDDLLSSIEKDHFEQALKETETAQDTTNTTNTENTTTDSNTNTANTTTAPSSTRLWVDRYAPSNFMDLLSDEQINRDVVHWLKSWDTCVFGKSTSTQQQQQQASTQRQNGGLQLGTPGSKTHGLKKPSSSSTYINKNKGNNNNAYQQHEADPFGRPQHKVILLCGPPGLGKTTLAHVVARHCGYRPLEINASDDRVGATLMARVTDAVQMASVMGEKRPNCVILDEIDGVAGSGGGGSEGRSAITALLKIIKATGGGGSGGNSGGGSGSGSNANKNNNNQFDNDGDDSDDDDDNGDNTTPSKKKAGNKSTAPLRTPASRSRTNKQPSSTSPQHKMIISPQRGTGSTKKGSSLRPLMRPIICICNDPYAPALRPLRDIAMVFHFRRPSADRLAHRLHLICSAEGLRVEKSTLRMLAERTECDIRACLNTLQFLAKRKKWVKQSDLMSLGLGQKDMTKGAFQVWSDLLHKKKASTIIGRASENDAQRNARLYDTLMDFGEHDLVLRGLHENLPHLRFFDMALQRTSKVFNDLQDIDVLMRHAAKTGDFSLFKYLPATVLTLTSRVEGPERPRLQWPRGSAAVKRRLSANRAVRQEWLLSMAPLLYSSLGPAAATLDVLPYMPRLLSPSLRPVSRHLYSKEEQDCVDALIGSLLSLGIRYSMDIEAPGSEYDDGGDHGIFPTSGGISSVVTMSGGEPPLQFRPAVHRLWTFYGIQDEAYKNHQLSTTLSMAARQMLIHETEMEAIRRSDAARQAAAAMDVDGNNESAAAAAAGHHHKQQQQSQSQQQQSQHRVGHVPLDLAQRLREAGVTGSASNLKEEKRNGTWLDKMRVSKHAKRGESKGVKASSAVGASRLPVLYKYNEGYTNAVKRPVKMRELLC